MTSRSHQWRRRARRSLAPLAAALAALALPAAASADPPGQVQITQTCEGRTFAATSGLGGSAAWVAFDQGRRVVFLPVTVTGTVTDAQGAVLHTFDEALGRRGAGATTSCSFSFAMRQDGADVNVTGTGEFVVRAE